MRDNIAYREVLTPDTIFATHIDIVPNIVTKPVKAEIYHNDRFTNVPCRSSTGAL